MPGQEVLTIVEKRCSLLPQSKRGRGGHAVLDERAWFTGRVDVVRRQVQERVRLLHEAYLRVHEIEHNADMLVRTGILLEAVRERPEGLAAMLHRLREGVPLVDALEALFPPGVPRGAAIAAPIGIPSEGREDEDSPDAGTAREIRRPQRQAECNALGPTAYIWHVGIAGPTVAAITVGERATAAVQGFRLVRVVDACEAFGLGEE
jgi:hypothetical protein